jgi:hypothetical protein
MLFLLGPGLRRDDDGVVALGPGLRRDDGGWGQVVAISRMTVVA